MIPFKARILALSVALAILVLGYVGGVLVGRASSEAGLSGQALLPTFQPSQAVEARLSLEGQAPVVLHKEAAHWFVVVEGKQAPASEANVETFLSSVSSLRKGQLAGAGAEHLAAFDLDDHQAGRVVITAAGGASLADILVGKHDASGYRDYLRLQGSTRVFLTRSSLGFYLSRDRSYWYRLFVFPDQVQGSTISAITVRGDVPLDREGRRWSRESYRLVRGTAAGSGGWSVAGRAVRLRQSTVDAAASNLAVLQGVDILLDARGARTEHRSMTVTVTTSDGKGWTLDARLLDNGRQFLVSTGDSPYPYLVNLAALTRSVLPLRDLLSSQ